MHPYSPSPPWHYPSLCPYPYPYCHGHSSSAPWLLLLLLLLPLHPQPDSNIASARLSWSVVHSSSATLLRSAVQGTAGFCPSLPCFMSPPQVTDLATRPRSFVSSLGGGNLTCACEPNTEILLSAYCRSVVAVVLYSVQDARPCVGCCWCRNAFPECLLQLWWCLERRFVEI